MAIQIGRVFLVLLVVSISRYSPACAAGRADDCDSALVLDTFNSTEAVKNDYRLAVLVDETTYNEIKKKVGASAVIYGSPATGNYLEWKKNISQHNSSQSESFSSDDARSMSWTRLGDNASNNYNTCLKTLAKTLKNDVLLGVDKATKEDIDLTVHWSKDQFGPSDVDLTWDPPEPNLPTTAHATSDPVHFGVKRPTSGEKLLVVRALDNKKQPVSSDSIVITAFPKELRKVTKVQECTEKDPCPSGAKVLACLSSADRPTEVTPNAWLIHPNSVSFDTASFRTTDVFFGRWSNPQCGLTGNGWHARVGSCQTGQGDGWQRCVKVRVEIQTFE